MKTKITILLALLFWVTQFVQSQDFITEWTFPAASTRIRFNALTADGPVNYTWSTSPSGNSGSGSFTRSTSGSVILSGLTIAAGDVVILSMTSSNLRRFYIDNGPDRLKLTDVIQWGDVPWTSMELAFYGCPNLQIIATDLPNLLNVSNTSQMFRACTTLDGPSNIGSWNTSSVTDMSQMFQQATVFNQNIGNWNTSSVTNMSRMFLQSVMFNQYIGNWITDSVTSMNNLFWESTSFNQDISNWNTANVTNMSGMFYGATQFNQYIGDWDVSIVNTMSFMFRGAMAFNQDISNWNTSAVTHMEAMFSEATSFNQNIGNWDTSSVIIMGSMFFQATEFNQDIGNWDTSTVETMSFMFENATSFNQDIGGWIISSVSNIGRMFRNATAFNQNIGNWDMSGITGMAYMFSGATTFNQDIGSWNTASATNMNNMFEGATSFNQDISNWNTTSATNFNYMFQEATSFNQNIGSWILKENIAMFYMFGNSGMDCNNYSATLVGWEANNPTVTNRTLGATGMLYGTSALAARNTLVTDRGWTISGDMSSTEACGATLSVDDLVADIIDPVFIYPNPSAQTFTLKFESSQPKVEISVFTISGQLILNQSFEHRDVIPIDLKQGSGIYFLQINTGNQSYTHKLIKI